MPTRSVRALVLLTFTLSLAALVHASSPQFWRVETQRDFLKGDLHDLAIDGFGRLILGPTTRMVYEASSPFLWSIAAAPDGTIYAGSGNEGKVFRIDPQGKASLLFDANELEVHALALAPDGTLYVGTSPNGRIYRINKAGAAVSFFKPDAKYIWALAVDPKGDLYAATGEKGDIYRITPDGKGAVFFKTNAAHATALAFDHAGNLLVGTASPARVLRVDPAGKGFVLLDSSFQEINALRVDDKGNVYAAAISGAPVAAGTTAAGAGSATTPAAPVPSVSTEITSMSVVDTSGGVTSGAGDAAEAAVGPKGAIYRIAPDGLWDEIWKSQQDAPYDLTFESDGALLVATGNRGRLYRLSGDPLEATLVGSADAKQVTAFVHARGHLYFATANPGKIFELSSKPAAKGTYESTVHDAQMVATWGTLRWHAVEPGGSHLEISTRSGNTQVPDDTWSPWSAPYTNPDGSLITSPKARYLQWRAVLSGAPGPTLTSVTTAYLPRNLRPTVESITVYPPGIVFQKPYPTGEPDLAGFEGQTTPDRTLIVAASTPPPSPSSGPSLGRRVYEKGLETFTWKADDPNNDDLRYDVLYRRDSDTSWSVLRRGLTDEILVWDTSAVPDGRYIIKIVASDAPSNEPAQALTGELESRVFTIDNTPPAVHVTSIRRDGAHLLVDFTAADNVSIVQGAGYAVDGQAWKSLYPTDGIADSMTERFEATLPDSLLGQTIMIRAIDAMNNITSEPVVLKPTTGTDAPRKH